MEEEKKIVKNIKKTETEEDIFLKKRIQDYNEEEIKRKSIQNGEEIVEKEQEQEQDETSKAMTSLAARLFAAGIKDPKLLNKLGNNGNRRRSTESIDISSNSSNNNNNDNNSNGNNKRPKSRSISGGAITMKYDSKRRSSLFNNPLFLNRALMNNSQNISVTHNNGQSHSPPQPGTPPKLTRPPSTSSPKTTTRSKSLSQSDESSSLRLMIEKNKRNNRNNSIAASSSNSSSNNSLYAINATRRSSLFRNPLFTKAPVLNRSRSSSNDSADVKDNKDDKDNVSEHPHINSPLMTNSSNNSNNSNVKEDNNGTLPVETKKPELSSLFAVVNDEDDHDHSNHASDLPSSLPAVIEDEEKEEDDHDVLLIGTEPENEKGNENETADIVNVDTVDLGQTVTDPLAISIIGTDEEWEERVVISPNHNAPRQEIVVVEEKKAKRRASVAEISSTAASIVEVAMATAMDETEEKEVQRKAILEQKKGRRRVSVTDTYLIAASIVEVAMNTAVGKTEEKISVKDDKGEEWAGAVEVTVTDAVEMKDDKGEGKNGELVSFSENASMSMNEFFASMKNTSEEVEEEVVGAVADGSNINIDVGIDSSNPSNPNNPNPRSPLALLASGYDTFDAPEIDAPYEINENSRLKQTQTDNISTSLEEAVKALDDINIKHLLERYELLLEAGDIDDTDMRLQLIVTKATQLLDTLEIEYQFTLEQAIIGLSHGALSITLQPHDSNNNSSSSSTDDDGFPTLRCTADPRPLADFINRIINNTRRRPSSSNNNRNNDDDPLLLSVRIIKIIDAIETMQRLRRIAGSSSVEDIEEVEALLNDASINFSLLIQKDASLGVLESAMAYEISLLRFYLVYEKCVPKLNHLMHREFNNPNPNVDGVGIDSHSHRINENINESINEIINENVNINENNSRVGDGVSVSLDDLRSRAIAIGEEGYRSIISTSSLSSSPSLTTISTCIPVPLSSLLRSKLKCCKDILLLRTLIDDYKYNEDVTEDNEVNIEDIKIAAEAVTDISPLGESHPDVIKAHHFIKTSQEHIEKMQAITTSSSIGTSPLHSSNEGNVVMTSTTSMNITNNINTHTHNTNSNDNTGITYDDAVEMHDEEEIESYKMKSNSNTSHDNNNDDDDDDDDGIIHSMPSDSTIDYSHILSSPSNEGMNQEDLSLLELRTPSEMASDVVSYGYKNYDNGNLCNINDNDNNYNTTTMLTQIAEWDSVSIDDSVTQHSNPNPNHLPSSNNPNPNPPLTLRTLPLTTTVPRWLEALELTRNGYDAYDDSELDVLHRIGSGKMSPVDSPLGTLAMKSNNHFLNNNNNNNNSSGSCCLL